MNRWNVSVSELVDIFKGAICALIPWLIRARIPYTGEGAYDDFDEICTVLFRRIVTASTEDALEGCRPLAEYGLALNNYRDRSFIRVIPPGGSQTILSLVELEFGNGQDPALKVAVLGEDLVVRVIESISCEGVEFALAVVQGDDMSELTDVEVEL